MAQNSKENMNKKPTPFWVEGMAAEDRDHQVSVLLSSLEKKLMGSVAKKDDSTNRVFVFVPDPPTIAFEDKTRNLDVHTLAWGVAGRAAVTNTVQVAKMLAPVMFDLWSDALYVIAFAADVPDDVTLGHWIVQVLQTGTLDNTTGKKQVLPNFALISFDWGDLIDRDKDFT
jgi:hypothetical protein